MDGRSHQTAHAGNADPQLMIPVFTLVVWTACVSVGVAGWFLHYPRFLAPAREPAPAEVTRINVDINDGPSSPQALPLVAASEIGAPPAPTAMPEFAAPSAAPAMQAVVAPSAAAFAVPADGLAVEVRDTGAAARPTSTPAVPPSPATASPGAPTRLTFGQGEARQPTPEYPREAAIARQQGTVLVRFTVGPDGRVTDARAATPCPFSLLNQAAVRTVREKWRFASGGIRVYEVSIEFQLTQR